MNQVPDLGQPFVAFAETVERDRWNLRLRLDVIPESKARLLSQATAEGVDEIVAFTPGLIVTVHARGEAKRFLDDAAGGRVEEDCWYDLGFGYRARDEMEVGLFAGPDPEDAEVPASIARFAHNPNLQANLHQVFQPRRNELVDTQEVMGLLSGIKRAARVLVYDVGQGNANALCDDDNTPLAYFDLGGGCYADRHTYPPSARQRFCWKHDPPVVLSHFDLDHFYSATLDQSAWEQTWIVPGGQHYGRTAVELLANIRARGQVRFWTAGTWHVNVPGLSVLRPGAHEPGRNKSGLIARVELPTPGGAGPWPVLLPADVPFSVVSKGAPASMQGLRALVATHHGAARCNVGPPPGTGTVAFSAGFNNSFGHPIPAARGHLAGAGWARSLETQTAPSPSTGNIVFGPTSGLHPPPCGASACTLTPRQQ